MQASALISYLPSPSEIAPTGQVSLQAPQETHASPITYAMGNTSKKKILFPNAHCAYNTTAHNLRCYKPILPQSRENASENTSKVFWQIKKTWPAFLSLCLILCLRALMTLANHAHFIFMVKFSGGLILLRRYLKHTSQKIYLNHSSAAFLRAHD